MNKEELKDRFFHNKKVIRELSLLLIQYKNDKLMFKFYSNELDKYEELSDSLKKQINER